MEGKIVVASIAPDGDEPQWDYKDGLKHKIIEPQHGYAKIISGFLKRSGYDVIDDWGETFGKTKPNKDIKLVLVMHGCRSQPRWTKRFEYLDKLSENVWCLMGSHLHTKYVIYDKKGYSGGNSFAIDPSKWGDITEVDSTKANDLHNRLYGEFVESNTSKYEQPSNRKFKSEPFVLLIGQVSSDSSTYFTNFKGALPDHNDANYQRTMWIALNELNKWGVKVLYKGHPKEHGHWSWSLREIIKTNIWKNCSIVDGVGIHELLDKCLGVVTINSGSGFEALLHLKPVITLGKVDYSIATKNCKTAQDIANAKDFVLKPNPEHKNFIKKFLYAHHHKRAVRTENNPYVNAVKILEGLI